MNPHFRAARLDRRIYVERKEESLDEFGAPVETWLTLGAHRAELVTEARSDSSVTSTVKESGAVSSVEEVITFRTRYIPRLNIADRLLYNGRAFEIIALTEIPRRRGWEIRARHRGLS
jgi:head-tail adaptor